MDAPIPEGTLIGNRWRVTGELGEGGFGRVFEATDESDISLGRAAVKLLHPNISPQERNAFLGEVKKIAALRHPNLVGYLDSGQQVVNDEIHPFLVTELCVGSLSDHLQAKADAKLGAGETLAVLADVSAGLDHLHQRSLIHRDIKPGNVLYADGNWKLADFGLMRDMTATGTYHRSSELMGTPMFMAPELFSTMTATAPSDVYALGVLAHLVGAGRPLHTGSGVALVHQITNSPPELDASLHPALRQLIARATDLEPANRPTAKAFHEFALANRADAQRTERSVGMFPPPVGSPRGEDATTVAESTGTSNQTSPSAAATAPPTVVSGTAPQPAHASTNLQAAPANAATEIQQAPHAAAPSDRGRFLLPALIGVALVAVVALGAVGYLLAQDDGTTAATATTAGDGASEGVAEGEPQSGETPDAATVSTAEPGSVDVTPDNEVATVEGGGGGPIDLSSPVLLEGSIDLAFDQDAYTFDGVSGESISLVVDSLNGECDSSNRWDLELQITDASGAVVGETYDLLSCNSAYGPVTLPADGQYSFVAAGGEGTGTRPPTGSYGVIVGKLLATSEDVSLPITIDGGISVALDAQQFFFDATAGQAISIQVASLNGVCDTSDRWDMAVGLRNASGDVVGEIYDTPSCGDAFGPVALPDDGTYSVVVFGSDGTSTRPPTGTYSLNVAALLMIETEVDLSTPVVIDGAIDVALDVLRFNFEVDGATRVSAEVLEVNGACESSNRWDLEIGVINSAGEVVGGDLAGSVSCGDALGPWELPEAGSYALVVIGGDGTSTRPPTGSVQIRLAQIGG